MPLAVALGRQCFPSRDYRQEHWRVKALASGTRRSLLVQVSWLGQRCNGKIREIFEEVCRGSKTRRKIAVIATARRLLVICWAMLRDGTVWRESQQPVMAQEAN